MENHQDDGNNNKGGMSCHNSPRRLAHIDEPQMNSFHIEMKTYLLKIIFANPFAGLDHEDPCTYLTKLYKLSSTLGAPQVEKKRYT